MKKFFAIASILITAFALSGTVLAQQKPAAKKAPPTKVPQAKIAKGEVSAVDTSARTLTLMERGKAVTFAYDETTKITEDGRTVEPSAITTGAKATVKYTEKDGKNLATSISLTPAAARPKKK